MRWPFRRRARSDTGPRGSGMLPLVIPRPTTGTVSVTRAIAHDLPRRDWARLAVLRPVIRPRTTVVTVRPLVIAAGRSMSSPLRHRRGASIRPVGTVRGLATPSTRPGQAPVDHDTPTAAVVPAAAAATEVPTVVIPEAGLSTPPPGVGTRPDPRAIPNPLPGAATTDASEPDPEPEVRALRPAPRRLPPVPGSPPGPPLTRVTEDLVSEPVAPAEEFRSVSEFDRLVAHYESMPIEMLAMGAIGGSIAAPPPSAPAPPPPSRPSTPEDIQPRRRSLAESRRRGLTAPPRSAPAPAADPRTETATDGPGAAPTMPGVEMLRALGLEVEVGPGPGVEPAPDPRAESEGPEPSDEVEPDAGHPADPAGPSGPDAGPGARRGRGGDTVPARDPLPSRRPPARASAPVAPPGPASSGSTPRPAAPTDSSSVDDTPGRAPAQGGRAPATSAADARPETGSVPASPLRTVLLDRTPTTGATLTRLQTIPPVRPALRSPTLPDSVVAVPVDLAVALENRWGLRVHDVPVHRGPRVADLVHGIDARAVAYRGHVFLPDGAGDLATPPARALLAHELVHVAQQRLLGGALPSEASSAGRSLERQARVVEAWVRATAAGAGSAPIRERPSVASPTHDTPTVDPAPLVLRAPAIQRPVPDAPGAGSEPVPTPGAPTPGLEAPIPTPGAPTAGSEPVPSTEGEPMTTALPGSAESWTWDGGFSSAAPTGDAPVQRAPVETADPVRPAPPGPPPEVVALTERVEQLTAQVVALSERLAAVDDDLRSPAGLARLAARLYPPIRTHLRAELIVDRERSGRLSDLQMRNTR